MISQWVMIVAAVVFGLGGFIGLLMLVSAFLRARRVRYDKKFAPLQTYSVHYYHTEQSVLAASSKRKKHKQEAHHEEHDKLAMKSTAAAAKTPLFDTIHANFYSPFVGIALAIILAINLILLWVGFYFDAGYWTRSDAVVVDFATWICVAINFPIIVGLLMSLAALTRNHDKDGVVKITVLLCFGVGLLLFFSVFVTNDHQFLYWGAAVFLHLIVLGIGYNFLTEDELMPHFKWGQRTEYRSRDIIRWIQAAFGIAWLYFLLKALWLVFSISYRNIWDNDVYSTVQMFTDAGFYLILLVLTYIIGAMVEAQTVERARYIHKLPFMFEPTRATIAMPMQIGLFNF